MVIMRCMMDINREFAAQYQRKQLQKTSRDSENAASGSGFDAGVVHNLRHDVSFIQQFLPEDGAGTRMFRSRFCFGTKPLQPKGTIAALAG